MSVFVVFCSLKGVVRGDVEYNRALLDSVEHEGQRVDCRCSRSAAAYRPWQGLETLQDEGIRLGGGSMRRGTSTICSTFVAAWSLSWLVLMGIKPNVSADGTLADPA